MISAYMPKRQERRNASAFAALVVAGLALSPLPALAEDPGKHACFEDAKRLCPAEVNALSRSKVKACMIVHLEQVSPQCHTYMIAERDKAMRAQKTEPSAQ
jgi:hypothetical protein